MNIADERKEVIRVITRLTLEPILKKMADSSILLIEMKHIKGSSACPHDPTFEKVQKLLAFYSLIRTLALPKVGCISFTFAPTEQEWYKCEGNLNGTMFHTRGSL